MEENISIILETADKENGNVPDIEKLEERFPVDRRKLEEMIQGAEDVENSTAGKFFEKISKETGTEIFWPTRLKIGAKSKKDPNIKVYGKAEEVCKAKRKILEVLEAKKNKVTLKMDIPYTDHSHIIGKGGSTIQTIMEETECHIHFPDSNRTNPIEKSNQVSITGQPSGVEQARCKLRSLLPIVVCFKAGSYSKTLPDPFSPAVQLILQNYGFVATYHWYSQRQVVVTARGSQNQFARFRQGLQMLMEYLTGKDDFKTPVTLKTDIAVQNHQVVMGPAGINIQHIKRTCGVNIAFQSSVMPANDFPPQMKSAVFISGSFDNVHKAWKQLMGYLPLSLSFNLNEGQDVVSDHVTKMMSDFKVNIMMRLKKKENIKNVTVQGMEKDSRLLFEVRRQILHLDETEVPVCCDKHATALASALYLATMSLTDNADNDLRKSPCNEERLKVINEFHTAMGAVNRNMLPVQATTDPELSSILSNVLEQLNKSGIDHSFSSYQQFPTNLPSAEFCIPQSTYRPLPKIKRQNNQMAFNSMPNKLFQPSSKLINKPILSKMLPKSSLNSSNNVCNPFFTSDIWSPQPEVMSSWPYNESSHLEVTASILSDFSDKPAHPDPSHSETPLCCSDLERFTQSSCSPFFDLPGNQASLKSQSSWDQGSSDISSVTSSACSSAENYNYPYTITTNNKRQTFNFTADTKPLQKSILQISKENNTNIDRMLDRNKMLSEGNTNTTMGSSLLKPDYDEKWSLAYKTFQQPLQNEARAPTNVWSGYGFSKSVPDNSFRDNLRNLMPSKLHDTEMEKENKKSNHLSYLLSKTSDLGGHVFSCSDFFDTLSKEKKLPYGVFNKLPELFAKLGLEKYTKMFVENEVDLSTFLTLSDADLQELGVTYKARKKMLRAISELAGFSRKKADTFHATPGAERKLIKSVKSTSPWDL